MLSKRNKNILIIFSVLFYIVTGGLMIYGTFNDLQVDMTVFNPENKLSIIFECFGEAVAWVVWGPMFTILFVTRHNLNESLDIIGRIFPFIHPVSNTNTKAYKVFNTILKIITTLGFFVLSVIGYKKVVENVAKKFIDISQLLYFVICAVIAVIAIVIVKRIDKDKLNRLESVTLACFLLSVLIRICMHLKPITNRVRFREMVAGSNGIFNDEGLTHGSLDQLTPRTNRNMLDGVDFSAYTPWYKKGDDMGIFNHPDSFPSGHTMSAACTFFNALVCSAYKRLEKLLPFALILSMAYTYVMGFTRMVEGAHYLTDVASGALIGYSLFLIVWKLYSTFNKKGILPTRKIK
ncbi:MAG: phosphatase PAP2 family protein [Clostridium sp.]|nr:phosphatase PAP2 family protein [Clostridium sp.]